MLKWILLITGLLLAAGTAALWFQPSLSTIHQAIVSDYQGVEHLSAQQLRTMNHDEIIVFDIREQGEYKVSHLDNAIWVPPDFDAQEFIDDYGDLITDKQAVFYCSVGRRSSEFISRVQEHGTENLKLVNLEGGMFNWVNNEYEISGNGIHPYNTYWGRLIRNQDKIKYNSNETAE